MTFTQFKYLSEDDQVSVLFRKKVELARITDTIYYYILYQVDGFYMEAKYMLPQKQLIEIICFEDLVLIEPYLPAINIDPVLRS